MGHLPAKDEERSDHYEFAANVSLGRRLLPPITDPEIATAPSDSPSIRSGKNNPAIVVLIILALLAIGLSFLSGILRW